MKDVLVVDDDNTMLEVLKRILAYDGIVAHCVSSGAEALEKMRERSFPLMITDFNMPGLNGLELARQGLEIAPQMRIIMDTSGISATNVRLAMEIGISKIVSKPFLPNEMLETVRGLMDTKELSCTWDLRGEVRC
jgi:DNA-binding NtrC family response regulator